jgi:hypothetical protein
LKSSFFKAALVAFWVAGGLAGCRQVAPQFPVPVDVEFGPANRPAIHETVMADSKSTPRSVLEKIAKVGTGEVCCDFREVAVINDVAVDPAKKWWWFVEVNGSREVSPYRTHLKPNDRVRWSYEYAPPPKSTKK